MVNGNFYTPPPRNGSVYTESVVYIRLPVNGDPDWAIVNGVLDALSRISVTD